MPKHHLYFFALAFLALASGCSLFVNPLTRLWFYTYGTGTAEGTDTSLNPSSFLELRPDGSYTRDFGTFQYGSWVKKDHQIILTSHDHQVTTLPFTMPETGDMKVTLTGGYIADFESRSIPSKTNDPYSLTNNRWRMQATHKETDREIRERLRNHCQFWEAYFRWALDNKLAEVDVRSTPTPIKIYHNGFTLKPFEDLPPEWVGYFYDKEDCQKANDMLKNIFERKSIAWANTDNPYKMFLSAFQQMSNYLR